MEDNLASADHILSTDCEVDDRDWRVIANDPPPHETLLLLYWMDWRNQGFMEAGYASTGERYPNGYSTMSFHGEATHWMPLPAPPKLDSNPLTGEPLPDAKRTEDQVPL